MESQELPQHLIDYVRTGGDDRLRAEAISKLSIAYMRSDDRMIGAVIAAFVKDESVEVDLRSFAYLCLLDLSSRTHERYPDMAVFKFPEDVDWTFVENWSDKSEGR